MIFFLFHRVRFSCVLAYVSVFPSSVILDSVDFSCVLGVMSVVPVCCINVTFQTVYSKGNVSGFPSVLCSVYNIYHAVVIVQNVCLSLTPCRY